MTWTRSAVVVFGVVILACLSSCKDAGEVADEAATDGVATEFSSHERLTNKQLLELAKQPQLEQLEIYDASDISDESWTMVLSSLSKLRRLRIEQRAVGDDLLASIGGLEKLEVLNLPDGDFSNVGLAKVLSLPKLMLLRIGSPNVTDDGFNGIANVESLRFLHLLNVPISDAGLVAFHDMDQLESLYIDNGQETEDGIRELLKKQPRLHFHRNQLHIAEDPNSDDH